MTVEVLYTTWGRVRGGCGHVHDTLRDAVDCEREDESGCRSQGGHTDRAPRKIDDETDLTDYDRVHGPGTPPTAWDDEEYRAYQDLVGEERRPGRGGKRAGAGRPAEHGEPRTIPVAFRLTESEAAAVSERAEEDEGLNEAARRLAVTAAKRRRP